MRKERAETSYSLSRFGFPCGNIPHTTLEHRKFDNQAMLFPVSQHRLDAIKAASMKSKKKIIDWIENYRPNGIEILNAVSETKSPYGVLIKRALVDLKIVEKRANIIIDQDLEEKQKNAEETETLIGEYTTLLQTKKSENQKLSTELEYSKKLLLTLEEDFKRRQSILKSVKSRIKSDESDGDEIDGENKFVDDKDAPIDIRLLLYRQEQQRLDELLVKLEERLLTLNQEGKQLMIDMFKKK